MTSRRRRIALWLIIPAVIAIAAVGTRARIVTIWQRWIASGAGGQHMVTASAVPSSLAPGTTARADVPLDLRRRQLIGVRTVAVTRAAASIPIRTLGVVKAAETRLTDVNVKVD